MPTRDDVLFPSADGPCAAWWYTPDAGGGAPAAVVVMAHGLGGVRSMRLDAFAERFAAAGYACLVFDYRHFGDSSGEPRQLLDVGRQLEDWAAAVAYARSRPDADPDRVVLWGTSFSGGHVLRAGADDGRVAAVVAQCPFTSGTASSLALSPVSSLRLAPSVVRDLLAAATGRPPVLVPLAGAPRSAALMSAPDVVPGYLSLGGEARNEVTARTALQVMAYHPGRAARRLRCPLLVCVTEKDSVAPARATKRLVGRARDATVLSYPVGHFDIYTGEDFETVVTDQLAFLATHVPASTPRTP